MTVDVMNSFVCKTADAHLYTKHIRLYSFRHPELVVREYQYWTMEINSLIFWLDSSLFMSNISMYRL